MGSFDQWTPPINAALPLSTELGFRDKRATCSYFIFVISIFSFKKNFYCLEFWSIEIYICFLKCGAFYRNLFYLATAFSNGWSCLMVGRTCQQTTNFGKLHVYWHLNYIFSHWVPNLWNEAFRKKLYAFHVLWMVWGNLHSSGE